MTAKDCILGYTLPLIPMFSMQITLCFIVAIILGLEINLNILPTIVVLIPVAAYSLLLVCFAGASSQKNRSVDFAERSH